MADWPRRMEGHYIDRELASAAGNVEYRFHCIKCGVRVDTPEDSSLKLQPCDSLTHGVGGRR